MAGETAMNTDTNKTAGRKYADRESARLTIPSKVVAQRSLILQSGIVKKSDG
jgi:hypothetical protein